jgi:glutathione S-transferase
MAEAGPPKLWHIEISNYNEKARWALDYKGLPHTRRAPFPGTHPLYAFRLTRGYTFPILEIDGRRSGDATEIIAELERRQPEPPLYPADPAERRRALELEDYFDENFGHDVRRLVFFHALAAPDAAGAVAEIGHAGPRARKFISAIYPLMRRGVQARYRIKPAEAERSLEATRAGLARIEAEAGPSGYLVGDAFSVADLTAAALIAPFLQPAQFPYPLPSLPPDLIEIRDSLAGPGVDWVMEMYSRHRGQSSAVPSKVG